MAQIKEVAIVLKPKITSEFENIIPNLISWLVRRKKNIYFLDKERDRIEKIAKAHQKQLRYVNIDNINEQVDLIITLGGDGTLIGIARSLKKNPPPIFGVNMGNLGFITEFSKAEFYEELEDTLKGNFEVRTLPLYQVEVFSKEKSLFKSYFLNDLVVNNYQISRMLTLQVCTEQNKNLEHIYNLSGDGLIVSSPIGSTAYSLAAGGPIIHPEVNALTLTPICPHSLTHRPMVISDNSAIEVKALKKDDILKITLDGQQALSVHSNDIIRVSKSKSRSVKLIINHDRTYFQTLKEKFTHGARDIK